MGSPRVVRESKTLAMKILFIVGAFLAAHAVADAEPEADPNAEANADPWYSYGYGLGHGYGYGGYGHYGYSAYRPYGYRYGGYWGRKKREADAEPVAEANAEAEADPWYSAYGYGLGHAAYRPYITTTRWGGYGGWGKKKRSAEAEPE